ncbi:hypothetical protein [[Clostridium] colinum]|uniref:hypothetical protein n=1 Tax=[Clostridium] colinum TaxID=36835 RepID=UPI0020251168|nr:hypothetical protein [[Clostridium] colinum]
MRQTKKVLTEKEEIYEVYCNMCGKAIQKDKFGKFCEYLSVDKQWGYLSSLDGQKHSFDLCDSCYKDIVSKFKIKVLDDEY